MARVPYSWTKVDFGDIISFNYATGDKDRVRRTVLVLDPEGKRDDFSKKLLHGIQLEVGNIPTSRQIVVLLKRAGEIKIVNEGKKIYRVDLDGNAKQVYQRMRLLLKSNDVFRTFDLKKCRKSQVFLEDLRLPPSLIKEIKDNR